MASYEEVWSGIRQSGERQLRAPSLSTAVTDRLTDNVRQEPAGTMSGDDTSFYRQSREQGGGGSQEVKDGRKQPGIRRNNDCLLADIEN